MNTKAIAKALSQAKIFLGNNSPSILTGIGAAGVVTTAVLAVKATPKALEICDMVQNEKEHYEGKVPTKFDYAAACWKYYVPAAVVGATSIACIIGANSINLKRNAALATLYSASELALKEYKNKVEETIGSGKASKIQDEIAQDILTSHPMDPSRVIYTGQGDTLCYDVLSGRYFKHDIEKIREIRNEFNQQLIYNDCMSLNELYIMLGLDTIGLGDLVGWTTSKLLEFDFRSKLASDGTPCLVIDYEAEPTFKYRNW